MPGKTVLVIEDDDRSRGGRITETTEESAHASTVISSTDSGEA